MPPFASSEHEALGNIAIPGLGSSSYQFTLSNGAKVTFGQLIALAGDYYGVADKPISLGRSEADCTERFLAAFKTLDEGNPADVNKLIAMIKKERKDIDSSMQKGNPEGDALDENAIKETLDSIEYTRQKYVSLAEHNVDHFSETAIIAYKTGHLLAIRTAVKASLLSDANEKNKQLAYAFALEGFACHFLTDLFAAGHIRTPRKALYNQFGIEVGALLSLFQHDEDGKEGLNVKNTSNAHWKSFGDGHLFEKYNEENKINATKAVEAAIQDVHKAFLAQRMPEENELETLKLIPKVEENNASALFKLNNENKLIYRSTLSDKKSNNYELLTNENLFPIFDYFTKEYTEESSVVKKMNACLAKITTDTNRFFSTPTQTPRNNDKQTNKHRSSCQCRLF